MAERIDIDALLIGALYGELTPADEARLTAHLASNPADRAALADLGRTRAAVRDSRWLADALEPPHAVSALLLQEAARRAPAREEQGWFYRFTRSFLAQPAMAAAAMLVLVVGVAGTLYVRGGLPFAEPSAPGGALEKAPNSVDVTSASGEGARASEVAAGNPAAAAAPAAPVAQAESAAAAETKPSRGKGAIADGVAQGSAYAVDVASDRAALGAPASKADAARDRWSASGDDDKVTAKKSKRAGYQELDDQESLARAKDAPAARGIPVEIAKPRLEPKELADAPEVTKVAKSEERAERAEVNERGRTAPGGGAAAAPPAPPAPVVAAPAAPAQEPLGSLREQVASESDTRYARPAKSPQSASPALPPPTDTLKAEPSARLDQDRSGQDKSAEDASTLEWAQQQRAQVIALAKADNCRAAASVANGIYERAPAFYAANVATDREIKKCMAYVNLERERTDRARAPKRAYANDAPAPQGKQAKPDAAKPAATKPARK